MAWYNRKFYKFHPKTSYFFLYLMQFKNNGERKLYEILFLLLFLVTPIFSQQAAPKNLDQCNQFIPYGLPTVLNKVNSVLICRTAYLVDSDTIAKIPIFVSYTLTPDHSMGCTARSNAFEADKILDKDKRADPKDYVGSGYDIGHQGPDKDFSFNVQVERESFILTNMAPQLPQTNRINWLALEEAVRDWSFERNHTLLIYVGPIYDIKNDKTIGDDKVVVPDAFYKIIVDINTNEVLSFIYPQTDKIDSDISTYKSDILTIENKTNITFHFPIGFKEVNDIWPVNLGNYIKAKKDKCGK